MGVFLSGFEHFECVFVNECVIVCVYGSVQETQVAIIMTILMDMHTLMVG